MGKYSIFCLKNSLFKCFYVYVPPEDTKITICNQGQGGILFIQGRKKCNFHHKYLSNKAVSSIIIQSRRTSFIPKKKINQKFIKAIEDLKLKKWLKKHNLI